MIDEDDDDERESAPAICHACGQKIRKLNPHRMDFAKVKVLRWIAEINRTYQWAKIQQDIHLIPIDEAAWTIQTDAVHATRLHWFGLIDRRGARDGMYRINDDGIAFLRGKLKVPSTIFCKDGVVVEWTNEFVELSQVKDVILDKEYWDNYASIQKWPRD